VGRRVKFALAVHGTRGDIEPAAAVGLELLRRGHDVLVAVPPNLIAFTEGVGLSPALAYGVDSQQQLDSDAFRDHWKLRNPKTVLREAKEYVSAGWAEMSQTLASLADGADLILTGTTYQEVAANVAEYHRIPLAALHYFPARANSHVVPVPLPGPVLRTGWAAIEWVLWQVLKEAEDAQRRELGLFPGLAAEWAGKRPLVGSITMGLGTDTDDEVASWCAAGKPPIYFGFGSMPVDSPTDAVAMIQDVCSELGERALISSGVWNLDNILLSEHVKVVGAVNHSAVFPVCRAVVHHGGAGTTAAGLRAGVPTLVLWVGADQPIWANQVKRLKAGTSQSFSRTTKKSLARALRSILTPQYVARAREVAAQMTKPAVSVRTAADLLEDVVRKGRTR
jgi:UDP:flavonoid glycosyltransferase YjiC (YdhE family)